MRNVWKHILTMINTAVIAGIVFYSYYADHNAAIILSFTTFVFVMIIYMLFKNFRRHRQRGNY